MPLSFEHHASGHIPNATTRQALMEAQEKRQNGTLGKGYDNLDEMKDILFG